MNPLPDTLYLRLTPPAFIERRRPIRVILPPEHVEFTPHASLGSKIAGALIIAAALIGIKNYENYHLPTVPDFIVHAGPEAVFLYRWDGLRRTAP